MENLLGNILIILSISTNVVKLDYLKPTFNNIPDTIDLQSWKRKWIILFTWLESIMLIVMSMQLGVSGFVVCFFPLMTRIIILNYLGMSFADPKSIDLQSWKRKWIIFFAWLDLLGAVFLLVSTIGIGHNRSRSGSRSSRRKRRSVSASATQLSTFPTLSLYDRVLDIGNQYNRQIDQEIYPLLPRSR